MGNTQDPERKIKAEILLALGSRPDVMVWNNPTGVGRAIDRQHVIKFGCPGSADILGVLALTIRPEHVGMTIGRALAVEVKTLRGRQRDQQKIWQRCFEERGGLYVLARSVEEAVRGVGL